MAVNLTVSHDNAAGVIEELRSLFGNAVFAAAGTPAPGLAEKRVEVIAAGAAPSAVEATTAEESKPAGEVATQKRTRRTKAEMEAARAAEAKPAGKQVDLEEAIAASQAQPEKSPETPGDAPSLDDVRAALKRLGSADGHGHDAVIGLLAEHGAKNASAIPDDKRRAVIDAVAAKLGG